MSSKLLRTKEMIHPPDTVQLNEFPCNKREGLPKCGLMSLQQFELYPTQSRSLKVYATPHLLQYNSNKSEL